VAQYHRTLPTTPRDILTIPPKGPTRSDRKGWADQQKPHAHKPTIKNTGNRARPTSVHQWIQAKLILDASGVPVVPFSPADPGIAAVDWISVDENGYLVLQAKAGWGRSCRHRIAR